MKVVVNKCYGGFGLSHEALKKMVLLNSKAVEGTVFNEKNGWKRKDFNIDLGDGMFGHHFHDVIVKDEVLYSFCDRYDHKSRTDPVLVKVVEEMGEKSYGEFAKLKIVEIPDDIEWEISEYDGIERIEEQHRSW